MIMTVERPMVVDADAISCMEGDVSVLSKKKAPVVVTPHPGEMAGLFRVSPGEIQSDRMGYAKKLSVKHGVVSVLKGAGTIVAGNKGEIYVNPTGNSGMASAGVGDVLTGMISAFIGQGMSPAEAAAVGVYVHGLAGDIALREKGKRALIATDVIDCIPEAFRSF